MPYNLNMLEKPGYLHVIVTGDNTKENVMGYLSDLYHACVNRKCSTVLIEENLGGVPLDIIDIYDIIMEASKNVLPAIRRIAYVDTNPQHTIDTMRFAETAAVNRGVSVRVFSDVSEAKQWLVGGVQ
jgi:hypothetical protein